MALEIPINANYPDQSISVTLDGVWISIRLKYSQRQEIWSMSISDSTGTILVSDRPLLANADPLLGLKIDGLPPGYFFVLDTSNTGVAPSRYDFGIGKRTRLSYYGDDLEAELSDYS